MTEAVLVLSVLLLAMAVACAWLVSRLQQCRKQLSQPKPDANLLLLEVIEPLIREQDPLGAVAKYVKAYELGQAQSRQGYAACLLLLQTMNRAWGLQEYATYQQELTYDPRQHRTESSVGIQPGTHVVVMEPGWSLNEKIVKYPFVVPKA